MILYRGYSISPEFAGVGKPDTFLVRKLSACGTVGVALLGPYESIDKARTEIDRILGSAEISQELWLRLKEQAIAVASFIIEHEIDLSAKDPDDDRSPVLQAADHVATKAGYTGADYERVVDTLCRMLHRDGYRVERGMTAYERQEVSGDAY